MWFLPLTMCVSTVYSVGLLSIGNVIDSISNTFTKGIVNVYHFLNTTENTLNGSVTPDDIRPPSSCQMVSGVFFESGASWKEDDCTSCTCQDGEITCYSQVCTPVDCRVPVLKKGQCCPACMGRLTLAIIDSLGNLKSLYLFVCFIHKIEDES